MAINNNPTSRSLHPEMRSTGSTPRKTSDKIPTTATPEACPPPKRKPVSQARLLCFITKGAIAARWSGPEKTWINPARIPPKIISILCGTELRTKKSYGNNRCRIINTRSGNKNARDQGRTGGPQQITISVCHLNRRRSSNRCAAEQNEHVVMPERLSIGCAKGRLRKEASAK